MEKTKTSKSSKKGIGKKGTCSLCGQLYNNFAFKGGYICEQCLSSIKENHPRRPKKE